MDLKQKLSLRDYDSLEKDKLFHDLQASITQKENKSSLIPS